MKDYFFKFSFLGNQMFSLLQGNFFQDKKNIYAALRMGLFHSNVSPSACVVYFTSFGVFLAMAQFKGLLCYSQLVCWPIYPKCPTSWNLTVLISLCLNFTIEELNLNS